MLANPVDHRHRGRDDGHKPRPDDFDAPTQPRLVLGGLALRIEECSVLAQPFDFFGGEVIGWWFGIWFRRCYVAALRLCVLFLAWLSAQSAGRRVAGYADSLTFT